MPERDGVISIEGETITRLPLPKNRYSFLGKHGDSLLIGTRKEILVANSDGEVARRIGGLKGTFGASADKLGRIWIGTAYGVYCEDNGTLTSVKYDSQEIKCSFVTASNDGTIYMSAPNKLFKVDGDTLTLVLKYNSLFRSLLPTRDGHLVIAVADGIYLYNRDRATVAFYNKDNGYTGVEPLAAQMAEDDNGNILIPSIDRLTSFNLRKLDYEKTIPKFIFTAISTSKDNITWEPAIQFPLKLNHKYKNIRFSYIGISYSATTSVKYRYRLDGFQNNWSNALPEREVVFNNLPPASISSK